MTNCSTATLFTDLILPKKRAPKGSLRGFHTCKTCGETYENRTGKKSYCSKECHPKLDHICVVCSSPFKASKKSDKSCSPKCSKEAIALKTFIRRKEEHESSDGTTGVGCQICGTYLKQLGFHLSSVHQINAEEYKRQFPDALTIAEATSEKYSNRISGESNPWFNHSGALSPFSKNNKKLKNLSTEDRDAQIRENIKNFIVDATPDDNRPMNASYWIKRGMTEDEAKIQVSKRQTTFSLEKCIDRYGEDIGKEKWSARQALWLSNYKKSNYSKISQRLFKSLLAKAPDLKDSIFANRFSDDENAEITIQTGGGSYKPDFYNSRLGAVIEFDGDYWHNRGGSTNVTREKNRDIALQKIGLRVLHVKECDYNKDKEKVIKECLEFLNGY